MKSILGAAGVAMLLAALAPAPAASQSVTRIFTQFDAEKCRHSRGKDVEDYGSWRCPGHAGIACS